MSKNLLRGKEWSLTVGIAMLSCMVLASIVVPIVSPYDAGRGELIPLQPPSFTHPFGTDNLGRDVFVRVFAASRLDIAIAAVTVGISLVLGTLVGAIMGAGRNGKISAVLTVVVDGVNAFPFIVLALAIVAVVGPSVGGVVLGIALTGWARYARVANTRASVVARSDYIHAARLLGYSRWRIMSRHVFPNVFPESLAFALSELVTVILAVAALSFLGAGVRPPTAEWGAMISEGRLFLQAAWWMAVFPGAALAVTALSIQLMADGNERSRRYG